MRSSRRRRPEGHEDRDGWPGRGAPACSEVDPTLSFLTSVRFAVARATLLQMLRDDELIRRFCEHRDRGDLERARELWEQLAIANFDRVQQLVKAFRFPGGQPLPVN